LPSPVRRPGRPARPAGAQQEESELAEALGRACGAELPKPERPAVFHLVAELPLGAGKVSRSRLRELDANRREPGAAA
jgi:hypothetical protein